MACGYPCEWVKEHIKDGRYTSQLLIVDDGEYLQCIKDGEEYYVEAIEYHDADMSHAPCEWIRKYWNLHGVLPPDYPCEWIRLHWNENNLVFGG